MKQQGEAPDYGPEEGKARGSWLTRTRMLAAGSALGGMIVGSLVGIGVQVGVESTGILGPSVESLIAEQEANFDDVNAKLEALQKMATDPQVSATVEQLARLLRKQGDLSRRASSELEYLGGQVASMKDQALAESGVSGGADFWLKKGESVNVGGRDQVFSLLGARSTIAEVNLSGTRKRLLVGDALPVPGSDRNCTIFYKLATPRADGRVGFDLNCEEAASS